jgi:hypothetical protein
MNMPTPNPANSGPQRKLPENSIRVENLMLPQKVQNLI